MYRRYLNGERGQNVLRKEDLRGKNKKKRYYEKEAVELIQTDKRTFVIKYRENDEIKEEEVCVETNGRGKRVGR